jgi:hypothetical protein
LTTVTTKLATPSRGMPARNANPRPPTTCVRRSTPFARGVAATAPVEAAKTTHWARRGPTVPVLRHRSAREHWTSRHAI